MPPIVTNCPLGTIYQNGKCSSIDINCIFFDENNKCFKCAPGYILSSTTCTKVNCQPNQFSQYGYCVDASPLCATFDAIMGNCLTCILGYYLQNDGSCLQGLAGSVISSTNPCPNGYYYTNFTCFQANPLCRTFNQLTGACTSCLDNTYFLNSVGSCVLISSFCGYRQYFNQGSCLPVNNLCDAYDQLTGNCLSCLDNTLLKGGICLYN
jgi:hypothetical protein